MVGTAIIVEPRLHPALRLVVRNIRFHLPNTWEIVVVHGTKNGAWVREELSDLEIRYVEIPYQNLTIADYNKLCLSRTLYELSEHENILIFQTDTLILNSPFKITDFLEYDYIGAPIINTNYMNGGFSLRKKTVFLELIEDPLAQESFANEDVIFSNLCRKYNKKIPSPKVAGRFSTETQLLHPTPFAIHKPWPCLTTEQLTQLITNNPDLETLIRAQYRSQMEEFKNRYYAVIAISVLLIIFTSILALLLLS
jgi:hypothetical protein